MEDKHIIVGLPTSIAVNINDRTAMIPIENYINILERVEVIAEHHLETFIDEYLDRNKIVIHDEDSDEGTVTK